MSADQPIGICRLSERGCIRLLDQPQHVNETGDSRFRTRSRLISPINRQPSTLAVASLT
jgi:hypothetical protein